MELPFNISEDENCTFISRNLLEQTENFDDWLDKNGVQFIITNDCLNDNMINNKLDPLLNQTNVSETFDNSSDTESSPYSTKDFQNDSGGVQTKSVSLSSEGIVKFETLSSKCNYLEEVFLNGLNVEFISNGNETVILLRNHEDKMIPFSKLQIALNENSSQLSLPKSKLAVNSIENITLAKDLKAAMPCLHLNSGLKLFICPKQDCDLVFTKMGAAKVHALVQIGHKPYKCDYPGCTWAFYNSFKLRRHRDSHTSNKDFICCVNNCGRKFTNIYNLNIHIKNHNRPATLSCSVSGCTMKFQTSRLREKHFKSHNISEAPFSCPQPNCNRAFFLMTGLTSHARTHSHKDSELRCDYPNCGKVFEQPCRLKEHARKHTGQRPYSCTYDQCKWSFTTASKLKRHQSTHTKERKFHCTIGTCNKSFLRSEHLKDHTLTHIGPRSFQCEVCSANFFGKSSLYLHLKKCHPDQDQMCARALPYEQQPEKPSADILLEQAIQSLGVPSDMILGTGLIPEEPLELLENENFSTVNLRDLD